MAATASNDHKRKAHFTFIWKINCIPKIYYLESPEFTVQSMEMTKWVINLNFYRCFGSIICKMHRVEMGGGPESIALELELSLLDSNGSLLAKTSDTKHFRKNSSLEIFKPTKINAIFKETRGLTVQCRIWRTRTDISKSELCFASTLFKVDQYSCIWTIKEFCSLRPGEERIRIVNSTTKGFPQLVLTLSLAEKNGEERVYIHVEAPYFIDNYEIRAEISLLDAEGMVFDIKRNLTFLSERQRSGIYNGLMIFDKRKLMSDAAVVLSDDVLLLRCELYFISHDSNCTRIEDYKLMEYLDPKTAQTEKSGAHFDELNKTAICPFKETVTKFKEDGTLSDVCLRAGNKSFPVHKLILTSRSPVFRAMFTEDMREKTSKCIDIPDLDADTMNRLLLYIYEDKVQDLTWETAASLFVAADKYELLTLKEKCSSFLKLNISESNICEILVLADMHHDESLRKSAQEFVLNNTEIIYSDVWKVFRDNHSKLALETTEQIICNMKHSRS